MFQPWCLQNVTYLSPYFSNMSFNLFVNFDICHVLSISMLPIQGKNLSNRGETFVSAHCPYHFSVECFTLTVGLDVVSTFRVTLGETPKVTFIHLSSDCEFFVVSGVLGGRLLLKPRLLNPHVRRSKLFGHFSRFRAQSLNCVCSKSTGLQHYHKPCQPIPPKFRGWQFHPLSLGGGQQKTL